MGDFNTTLFHGERVKNGKIVNCSTSEMQSFVQHIDVQDLKATGIKLNLV